jgi:predicted nucleic acid-binding protein
MDWLRTIPRGEQFTSALSIGELYRGAFRTQRSEHHLVHIERRLLPSITVLPYDVAVARQYGRLRARLESEGNTIPEADIQIAATALHHGLVLVTGSVRHFERIEGLVLELILSRTLSE